LFTEENPNGITAQLQSFSRPYIQLCAEYANPKDLLTKACLIFKEFMLGWQTDSTGGHLAT